MNTIEARALIEHREGTGEKEKGIKEEFDRKFPVGAIYFGTIIGRQSRDRLYLKIGKTQPRSRFIDKAARKE